MQHIILVCIKGLVDVLPEITLQVSLLPCIKIRTLLQITFLTAFGWS